MPYGKNHLKGNICGFYLLFLERDVALKCHGLILSNIITINILKSIVVQKSIVFFSEENHNAFLSSPMIYL